MGEEIFDDELVGMVNYSDDTAPQQMPVLEMNETPSAEAAQKTQKKQSVKRIAEDCGECPFFKKRTLIDKLYDATKWLAICGGISMLMWWFNVNGLMLEEASEPCVIASAIIGAFGAGRSSK